MTHGPGCGRLLRALALPLIAGGLALHLWLGMKAGLVVMAGGLAAHVLAAVLGRRWVRRRAAR
ncbi:hypothetical protein [Streptomyces sp. MK37H]|uniref:hypothetical protein n=1 Tax=Streptomyces sp. MK37H TaxID=2699117 RepID=UPI001B35B631|nr:hypothetical protein [Streptomyces sp. MK37H]MBP8535537.1 hypothetical protein [Streptomyces sp. MK37H]